MTTPPRSYCVARTTGTPSPGTIRPIYEHIDLENAIRLRQRLDESHPDQQYAVFDESIGVVAEGLVVDESGLTRRR